VGMRRLLPAAAIIVLTGCGGSGSSPASPSPGGETTITITSSGVSPSQVNISQGTRVLFVNNDTKSHNVASDPHPEHTDCPPINNVGLLQPGQSRETGNMTTVRTCGFHDHDDPPPGGVKFSGRIVIQ